MRSPAFSLAKECEKVAARESAFLLIVAYGESTTYRQVIKLSIAGGGRSLRQHVLPSKASVKSCHCKLRPRARRVFENWIDRGTLYCQRCIRFISNVRAICSLYRRSSLRRDVQSRFVTIPSLCASIWTRASLSSKHAACCV